MAEILTAVQQAIKSPKFDIISRYEDDEYLKDVVKIHSQLDVLQIYNHTCGTEYKYVNSIADDYNNTHFNCRDLSEAQKVEEENAQIVQMVKAVHLDGTQLAAFLSAYASGEITLPQPEATYPAEQEDNDNEE